MVTITEAYDGFSITIRDGHRIKTYSFDQEESIKDLVKVFEELGLQAEYEEDY